MGRLLLAIAVVVLAMEPAAASDTTEVIATVHQFIDGFNKGDVKSGLAACSDETSIIDDFPPHEWHGSGACAKWAHDFDADATRNGITDGVVTLGKPRRLAITSDRAYVVLRANYVYKARGKIVREMGSTFTVSLLKAETGWHINGWAWAQH